MDDKDNKDIYEPLKLFVSGLTDDATEDTIRDYFEQYGTVDRVRMVRKGGKSRNFVFVMYDKEESIEKCLEEKSHVLNGNSIEVKRAIQMGMILNGGVERRKVFVGGLQETMSKEDVKEAIAKLDGMSEDDVHDIDIMTHIDTEKSRGFGFITMRSNALAVKLVKVGNTVIKDTMINFDHAIPKGESKGSRRNERQHDDYNYDDRRYEDRRYEDRRYEDRRYEDRRYEDRYYSGGHDYDYYDDRGYGDRYSSRYAPYPPSYRRHAADRGYDDRPRMGPSSYRGGPPERPPPERPPPRDYYGSDYGPSRRSSYYDKETAHPYARR